MNRIISNNCIMKKQDFAVFGEKQKGQVQEAAEQKAYEREYLSINFQHNDLIDLVSESPSPPIAAINNFSEFMTDRVIEVEKPQLVKEGYLTSYKLYRIKTKKRRNEEWETIVSRRFNDFEFLHHVLLQNYGGYVLPHLPNKNFLASLNLETKEFQDGRVSELRRYVERLINHPQVKFSQELRWFLFDQDYQFSSEKGEFIQKTGTLSGIKTITDNVITIGKSLLHRYVAGGIKSQPSKGASEESELKMFSQEIEDLMEVTKQIKGIINYSYQELEIVKEFLVPSPEGKDPGKRMQILIREFEEISEFIEDCFDAIVRTNELRDQLCRLEEQEAKTAFKESEKPRSRELDSLRSKLSKLRAKYERWTKSLKQELSTYTHEGKTLMQSFVKRFIIEKNRIYAIWTEQTD